MRLIDLGGSLAAGLLLAPLAVEAQQTPPKVYCVGVLSPSGPNPPRAWERSLQELGYVEGQNLVVERRYALGKSERLPAPAQELVRLKPDVIVATGRDAIIAAKNATTTIPIVMAFGGPSLVQSLARLGGNVTDVAYAPGGTLLPKRFEPAEAGSPLRQADRNAERCDVHVPG
jgi:ABC-type uncharacterized transport system substrate-binding protein